MISKHPEAPCRHSHPGWLWQGLPHWGSLLLSNLGAQAQCLLFSLEPGRQERGRTAHDDLLVPADLRCTHPLSFQTRPAVAQAGHKLVKWLRTTEHTT